MVKMKHLLLLLIISITTFFSCSSLPGKKEERTLDIRNNATEYLKKGITYYNSGRYKQALDFFDLALQLNTSIDNEEGNIRTLNSIGKTKLAEIKHDDAFKYFEQAMVIAERIEDYKLILLTKGNLVDYHIKIENLESALVLLNSEINALNDIKDEESAYLAHNYSLILRKQKKYEESLEYLYKSLKFNEKNKAYRGLAADYYMLASIRSLQMKYEEAKKYALEALKFDKLIEFPQGIASDLQALAIISEKSGNMIDAEVYNKRSQAVLDAIGNINQLENEQTDLDHSLTQ
ncbi:MAG: tetratricopeptide repeat protein [Spirochaetaceae bacterium]|jgi:tetratricopeptide (TPR) repeat protein|nr:tetratricopeptide repeat protein [Spirochaetaceae bacterium]